MILHYTSLYFLSLPTGRLFATTGRLGDVAVHTVTPGSVAGMGDYSRWTVPAQALSHGMPTRTAALSWARGGATASSNALVGACDTKVCTLHPYRATPPSTCHTPYHATPPTMLQPLTMLHPLTLPHTLTLPHPYPHHPAPGLRLERRGQRDAHGRLRYA